MDIEKNILAKSLLKRNDLPYTTKCIPGKVALIVALLALLAGCATVSVYNGFDPGTDFSNLKTYAWAPKGPETTGDTRIDNNTPLHTRIQNAIDTKLTLKGFQKNATNTPDFLVQYHVIAEDKKDILHLGPSTHEGPDSRWNEYFGDGSVASFHYTEGTLIINITDPQTNKLIWRGIGTALAEPDASPERKTRTVNNAVAQILTEFPPQTK